MPVKKASFGREGELRISDCDDIGAFYESPL